MELLLKEFTTKHRRNTFKNLLYNFIEKIHSKRYNNRSSNNLVELFRVFNEDTTETLCEFIIHNALLPLYSVNEDVSTIQTSHLCSLIAKSFLCLYSDCRFNCTKLFYCNGNELYKLEKLKCIYSYFKVRMDSLAEDSVITIKRSSSFSPQSIPPFISTDTTPIQLNLLVDSTPGKSMDDYFNSQTDTKMFHMDFANRSIGGGVLGRGCLQEEIKFSVYTELIGVMILLRGKGELKDCEGLLVEGVSRYSITEGYGRQSFKFVSPCDKRQIRQNVLVLDAQDYSFTDSPLSQFTLKEINREILKLSAGLSLTTTHSIQKRELVTGNWGCGAFGGNVQLKSLLQLMCAAEYGVDLVVYFTFGDQRFYDTESSGYDIHPLEFVYERIIKNRMTTKQLYDLLLEYSPSELSLFDYILSKTEFE